jgi:tRNA A-37 threonylcarbamoyl transferase component Bud32
MRSPESFNPTPEEEIEKTPYQQVSTADIFANRANRGENADVRETDEGMVEKSDKKGKPPILPREFIITDYLRNTGVVPKVDVDTGLYGYPLTFQMEKINNGASLQDWLYFYAQRDNGIYIPKDLIAEILDKTAIGIKKIWDEGVIHGDLHLNNIIIGENKDNHMIDPRIIDFGLSIIDEETLIQAAHNLGIKEQVEEAQESFTREINAQYKGEDGETEFLISHLESYICEANIPDLQKLIVDFNCKLKL